MLLTGQGFACCSVLLGTVSCKTKTPPPEVVPPPVEEATETEPVSTEPEPLQPDESFPENFAECRTELDRAFGEERQESTDLTKECCDKYAQHLDSIDTSFGVYRDDCCDVLNWMGSMACTPWGPPGPPRMAKA